MSAGASRPLVALATSADWPDLAPDDRGIAPALAALGIEAQIAVWTNDQVDWQRFDLTLVRSCWDYHQDLPRWLTWVDARDAAGALGGPGLCNPATVLRWNARKTYLAALGARGVPTLPTRWLDEQALSSIEALVAALAASPWDELVCKPAVSAGALGTFRCRRSELSSAWAVPWASTSTLSELARRAPLLVQPFVHEIVDRGEWSLLFFDGRFSHAVIKRPAAGDFRVQEKHGGTTVAATPSAAALSVAAHALAVAVEMLGLASVADLLYARVDLVELPGGPTLVELELIEPALFLETAPAARAGTANGAPARPVDTLAAAIARRLRC